MNEKSEEMILKPLRVDPHVTRNRNRPYESVPKIDYDDDIDDRREKPWQRAIYESDKKRVRYYDPVKPVPLPFIILVLGFYLLLAYCTQLVEDQMPTPIKEADVSPNDTTTFSEEAAWKYLYEILGDEPRVAGTRYHLQKAEDLKRLVDNVAGQAVLGNVRTDWQIVTGNYFLNKSPGYVNYYENASNIIAILEGEAGFNSDGTTGPSVLLNCHYDSVPFALGASDNALFCAVLVETLSRLAKRNTKFRNNVIFLFNGAEENGLMASHGFLKHPWEIGVTSVVNLDAAGMNGKPSLFQITDPRVLSAYTKTRRPSGQSVGEFLFTTGVIPSDTDFRIWRDFGNIYGIDLAFTKMGHVYHTRYDAPSLINPGVIQNAGETILDITNILADRDDLGTRTTPTAAVYYDFLNTGIITYSLQAAMAVDVLVSLFALTCVGYFVWVVGPRWSSVIDMGWVILGRLVSMLCGMLTVLILTGLSVAAVNQMRYISQPWIIAPMYWIPYVAAAVYTSHMFDAYISSKSGLNRSLRAIQAAMATRCILAFWLLLLCCVPGTATVRYTFSAPLFIMSIASLITLLVVQYVRLKAWQQLLLDVVLSIPTVMFLFTCVLRLDALMIPVMGRAAGNSPDYLVAGLNTCLVILLASSVSGIELLFSRVRLWMYAIGVLVVCIIVAFIPMSPYNDNGPNVQRHYWFHSEIVSFDFNNVETYRTSGILIIKQDPYTMKYVLPSLEEKSIQLNYKNDFTDDCNTYTYCNLPMYRVLYSDHYHEALFLYTGPPTPFTPAVGVTASRTCSGTTCTMQLRMMGSFHNTLTIWPRTDVNVTSWSLDATLNSTRTHLDRPIYIIVHSCSTYNDDLQPMEMNVTFNVPTSLQSQPIADVTLHANRIHHPEDFTQEYLRIHDAMPAYMNIATHLTFRYNYEF